MKQGFFMQRTLVLWLIVAILLIIFTLQNAQIVEVRLWFWRVSANLSLVLFLSIGIGVVISIVFTTFAIRRKNTKSSKEEEKESNE
jgi:uncharacterized integral membrane protein